MSRAPTTPLDELSAKIASRGACVGVVGLGYVGLPLVAAVHAAGFGVLGFDTDPAKIERLERADAYLTHLGQDLHDTLAASERFIPTSEASDIARADIIILCVPTPLGEHREPDLSFVESSTETVARALRPGQLVVLESTTYPGTTRELVAPILERSTDLVMGRDYAVAYSPEREDPGRDTIDTARIPKLVGGLGDAGGELAHAFYASCIERVIRVRSAEVAEAAKLLENVYRAVNIALINELKVVFERMGIDVWEVIEAARTKPFGFQAFYPGPGLGGHCIPIDPFYLAWRAKAKGHPTRFIELAGEINRRMPARVVRRVMDALNDDTKPLRGSRVLVIGVAYKPGVDDIREAPSAEIITRLERAGAEVSYHDPLVPRYPSMRRYSIDKASVALTPDALASSDCVLIVTDHPTIDYKQIAEHAPLIVDTRNAIERHAPGPKARLVKA